jgi:glycosyltransferase involved in cell wall biosynthesis
VRVRILYTINNLNTAGSKYVLADLVRSIDKDRFEPVVAVSKKTGTSLERDLERHAEIHELSCRVSQENWFRFPVQLRRAVRRLRGFADLAQSFDYSSDWSEGLAMRLAGIPWVAVKTNLSWNARRWKLRCSFAKRIVCLSNSQMNLLRSYREKTHLIPVGVAHDAFANATPASREEFGFSDDDVILVSVAHLVPVKGHSDLVRAFLQIHHRLPRLRLLLVGEGDAAYERELRHVGTAKEMCGKIVFAGRREDVPALLKMSDGKILATRDSGRREAFGTAIVQAMHSGLPVIATRSGGPEDIVIHGETGWLVSAEGEVPLAVAMEEFYGDRDRRLRYGAAGQRRAAALYGRDLMVERYHALYEGILSDVSPMGAPTLSCASPR